MAAPALERLCKWRSILAGRIAGSMKQGAHGSQGWRDLMEKQLIYRAELNALAQLLIKKDVFTTDEFLRAIEREADLLETDMQRQFPGMKATAAGIQIVDVDIARKTMADQGFPP